MQTLIELFQQHAGEVYDLKRLFRELKLNTHPLKMLCVDCLDDLLVEDYIKETEKYSFTLNAISQVMEGVFHRKSNGKKRSGSRRNSKTSKPSIVWKPLRGCRCLARIIVTFIYHPTR